MTFSEFSTRTPGYIAMVQKTVAAMGEVLVLVGSKAGSTFQSSAKHLHCQYHRECQIIELNNNYVFIDDLAL